MTVYQAKNGKGETLRESVVSLAELREQFIKHHEDNHECAPDIVTISVYHDELEFDLHPKDVKKFNDVLADSCDFRFWKDEDSVSDWREVR